MISASSAFDPLPIVAIVEAQKDDIDEGLAPCAGELYAAYLLNGDRPPQLHGAVTTGTEWKFLRFDAEEKLVRVDRDRCFEVELPRLLGALHHIVETTLAVLGPT